MVGNRLALKRILSLLQLKELFEEEPIWRKKPKPVYKTTLRIDQTMNTYVSVLLSVIAVLISLSIPVAALRDPSAPFRELSFCGLHAAATWLKRNAALLDRLIIVLIGVLTCVSTKTIVDAILVTKICRSPWLEQGKYKLPERPKQTYVRFTGKPVNDLDWQRKY